MKLSGNFLLVFLPSQFIHAFTPCADAFATGPYLWGTNKRAARSAPGGRGGPAYDPLKALQEATGDVAEPDVEAADTSAVRAPLKFFGPYPCLSLRFPHLATSSMRERNATGISLDFVLDTAANTNTINAQVAAELGLDVVGQALPGVGAGGAISGGDTYMLGECELDGLPKEERFTLMTGLTASALPVASPSGAGLFGIYFFNAFPGGVELAWGGANSSNPPAVTFYADPDNMGDALNGLQEIPIESLPLSGLPSVTLTINGVGVPALFDTGSPITVLNAEAAKLAGVETVVTEIGKEAKNPFARLSQGFKTAQAAARGDIVMIAGASGMTVELLRSKSKVDVKLGSVDIGQSNVYVGELPGLAALDGLGGSAPPAVVLGMDVLRLRPRLVYRANEVFM